MGQTSSTRPITPEGQATLLQARTVRSPRSSVKAQKQGFLEHLKKWAIDHDTSAYFNGVLDLKRPANSDRAYELGASILCNLSYRCHGRRFEQQIVIRLYPPQNEGSKYRLQIRNGSGWTSEREFFDKVYWLHQRLAHRRDIRPQSDSSDLESYPKTRSGGTAEPRGEECVAVHPLFPQFDRLPPELQDTILSFAINRRDTYKPSVSRGFTTRDNAGCWKDGDQSHCSLTDVSLISPIINSRFIRYLYLTTTFHFGTAHLTHFLWSSGPIKRTHVRRITLEFGQFALIHCLRWAAPNPIFELFETPMAGGLQLFWRCQIQELAKDVKLETLCIEVNGIPDADVWLVIRLLTAMWGELRNVQFVDRGQDVTKEWRNKQRSRWGESGMTWFALCSDVYKSVTDPHIHRHMNRVSSEVREMGVERFEQAMQANMEFFGS